MDNVTGTTGNDTFTASNSTLQTLDSVNGGNGTDTLLYVDSSANGVAPSAGVTYTSIENINLRNISGTAVPAVAEVTQVAFSDLASTKHVDINGLVITGRTAVAAAYEVSTVAFAAFANAGDFISYDGRTATAISAASPEEVSLAFVSGASTAKIAISGSLATGQVVTHTGSGIDTFRALNPGDQPDIVLLQTNGLGAVATILTQGVTAVAGGATATDVAQAAAAGATVGGAIVTLAGNRVAQSATVSSNVVTFTANTAGTQADFTNGGDGTANIMVLTQGANAVNSTNTYNVSAAQFVGAQTLNSDQSTGGLNFTAIAAGQTLGKIGGSGALSGQYADSATTSTIAISGGSTGGAVSLSGSGLLSTTINSTGAANVIGELTLAASETGALTINATTGLKTGAILQTTADALTSLVVTGAGAVDVSAGALMTTIKTVNASASTGGLSVVTGNTATGDATTAGLTVTGSSAADVIDIRASNSTDYVTVTTGTGADTVKVLETQIGGTAPKFTVTGNSASTLVIDFANETGGTQTADLSKAFVGFGAISVISNNTGAQTETLAMGTNKLVVSNISWDADAADTFTLDGLAAAQTVTINNNAAAVNATIGTDTKADVLNVVLNGTTLNAALTATSYETVNITSNTDKSANLNGLGGLTASSAKSVVITGSASLNTGTLTTAAGGTVDASAMTVAAIKDGTTLTATLTSTTTTFKGGAEVDALTLAAGTLAQGYSYDGGSGADTIAVSTTLNQNANILALSNFKTVTVTTDHNNADTATLDLRNVTKVANIVFQSGDAGDSLNLSHHKPWQVITLSGTTTFAAVGINSDSGTSETLAFGDSLTVTTLTIDPGTTVLTLSEVTGKTATITNGVSGAGLTSVTLTGAGSFVLTGAQATTVTSIDGSALSAGTVTATLGNVAGTLKGGAGADTLTGGTAADVINGGAGADTIKTGGGLDTLTGGDTNKADIFIINGVAGTATAQITITDFATAAANTANTAIVADVLEFSKAGVSGIGTPVVSASATNLSGATSVASALNLLAAGDGHTANSIVTYGSYGGDTYVVYDTSAVGTLTTADVVVKLVGVTNLAFADITLIA